VPKKTDEFNLELLDKQLTELEKNLFERWSREPFLYGCRFARHQRFKPLNSGSV
jgi:hypothetical protein